MFEIEKNRLVRASNVIIQNICEQNTPDTRVRNEGDIKAVTDLFKEVLEFDLADYIKHVIRLGKYDTERAHPRLIKVIFEKEENASQVLRSLGKLRNAQTDTNSELKDIHIFKDLTQTDREKRKALVEQMKEQNEELKKNHVVDQRVVIRGDKLVKVKVDTTKQKKPF